MATVAGSAGGDLARDSLKVSMAARVGDQRGEQAAAAPSKPSPHGAANVLGKSPSPRRRRDPPARHSSDLEAQLLPQGPLSKERRDQGVASEPSSGPQDCPDALFSSAPAASSRSSDTQLAPPQQAPGAPPAEADGCVVIIVADSPERRPGCGAPHTGAAGGQQCGQLPLEARARAASGVSYARLAARSRHAHPADSPPSSCRHRSPARRVRSSLRSLSPGLLQPLLADVGEASVPASPDTGGASDAWEGAETDLSSIQGAAELEQRLAAAQEALSASLLHNRQLLAQQAPLLRRLDVAAQQHAAEMLALQEEHEVALQALQRELECVDGHMSADAAEQQRWQQQMRAQHEAAMASAQAREQQAEAARLHYEQYAAALAQEADADRGHMQQLVEQVRQSNAVYKAACDKRAATEATQRRQLEQAAAAAGTAKKEAEGALKKLQKEHASLLTRKKELSRQLQQAQRRLASVPAGLLGSGPAAHGGERARASGGAKTLASQDAEHSMARRLEALERQLQEERAAREAAEAQAAQLDLNCQMLADHLLSTTQAEQAPTASRSATTGNAAVCDSCTQGEAADSGGWQGVAAAGARGIPPPSLTPCSQAAACGIRALSRASPPVLRYTQLHSCEEAGQPAHDAEDRGSSSRPGKQSRHDAAQAAVKLSWGTERWARLQRLHRAHRQAQPEAALPQQQAQVRGSCGEQAEPKPSTDKQQGAGEQQPAARAGARAAARDQAVQAPLPLLGVASCESPARAAAGDAAVPPAEAAGRLAAAPSAANIKVRASSRIRPLSLQDVLPRHD